MTEDQAAKMDDLSKKVAKKPKKKRLTRLKNINFPRLEKKLLNILDRDINNLYRLSMEGRLEKDDAQILVNYLKLLKQFNISQEEIDSLSNEELEKIASKLT